jgi:hypothetical protein
MKLTTHSHVVPRLTVRGAVFMAQFLGRGTTVLPSTETCIPQADGSHICWWLHSVTVYRCRVKEHHSASRPGLNLSLVLAVSTEQVHYSWYRIVKQVVNQATRFSIVFCLTRDSFRTSRRGQNWRSLRRKHNLKVSRRRHLDIFQR